MWRPRECAAEMRTTLNAQRMTQRPVGLATAHGTLSSSRRHRLCLVSSSNAVNKTRQLLPRRPGPTGLLFHQSMLRSLPQLRLESCQKLPLITLAAATMSTLTGMNGAHNGNSTGLSIHDIPKSHVFTSKLPGMCPSFAPSVTAISGTGGWVFPGQC